MLKFHVFLHWLLGANCTGENPAARWRSGFLRCNFLEKRLARGGGSEVFRLPAVVVGERHVGVTLTKKGMMSYISPSRPTATIAVAGSPFTKQENRAKLPKRPEARASRLPCELR